MVSLSLLNNLRLVFFLSSLQSRVIQQLPTFCLLCCMLECLQMLSLHVSLLQNRDQATAPAPEHSSAAPACNSLSHDASPEDDSELDKRDCQASHSESVDHLPDQVGAHSSVFTCVFVSRPPRCSAWSQTHASVLSKGTCVGTIFSLYPKYCF